MNNIFYRLWCYVLSMWHSSHSNLKRGSAMMQESSKQAPSLSPEEKPLDIPAQAAEAPARPDQGLDVLAAPTEQSDLLKTPEAAMPPALPSPTELSDLLKAPDATTESAPPASTQLSDLLKAPDAATDSTPPSPRGSEGAASPAPAPPVAPSPTPASESGSPLSVLVSSAAYARHSKINLANT